MGYFRSFRNSLASFAYLLFGSISRSFWRSALASLFLPWLRKTSAR